MSSANIMNRELADLSREYQVALRNHLKRGPRADLEPAQGLGRQAMTMGLDVFHTKRELERVLQRQWKHGEPSRCQGGTVQAAGA